MRNGIVLPCMRRYRTIKKQLMRLNTCLRCDLVMLKSAKWLLSQMQHKNEHIGRATEVLEKFIDEHPAEADPTAVNLLAELHMGNKAYSAAISQIDRARVTYCSGPQGLPLDLAIKAGICHVHLGNLEVAERYFEELRKEGVEDIADLVLDVGDTYLSVGKHHTLLEGNNAFDNASLSLKIAESYMAIGAWEDAIGVYYRGTPRPSAINERLFEGISFDERLRSRWEVRERPSPQGLSQMGLSRKYR